MPRQFTCIRCGDTCYTEGSEEEALAEAARIFGELAPDERVTVCDDCYTIVMAWYNGLTPEQKADAKMGKIPAP